MMNRKDFLKSLVLAPVTAKVLMDAKALPAVITRYNHRIFEYPMTPTEAFIPDINGPSWIENGLKRMMFGVQENQEYDQFGNTRWVPRPYIDI